MHLAGSLRLIPMPRPFHSDLRRLPRILGRLEPIPQSSEQRQRSAHASASRQPGLGERIILIC